MFEGTTDYMQTRQFGEWLGVDYISMNRTDYETIYDMYNYLYEPWDERIYLEGTDAN